jgi:photosystem II stability/assembly factor-like uncharacterized protein/murein DD-endopeptidase MepM/ murein hydrolase activator NlpD
MKTSTTFKNRFYYLFLFLFFGVGNVWGQIGTFQVATNYGNEENDYTHSPIDPVFQYRNLEFTNRLYGKNYTSMPTYHGSDGYFTSEFMEYRTMSIGECSTAPNGCQTHYHKGFDQGSNGNPVNIYSPLPGKITVANTSTGTIAIYNEQYNCTLLILHCSQVNVSTNSANNMVNIGTYLGKSGMEGNATGVHTHCELRKGNASSASCSCQTPVSASLVYDPRILVDLFPNNKPINQSLPIYAGTKTDAKDFEIFFTRDQINDETPNEIIELKIGGITIPNSSLTTIQPNAAWSDQVYAFMVQPSNNAFNSLSNNNSYNISFKVKTTANHTYTFSGGNQVYLKEKTSLDASLANADTWIVPYVRNGISWGLFTGQGGVSSTSYGATQNLTRAQAAVVIVRAAIYAHTPERLINSSNSNNNFTDINTSHFGYIYAHTLKNWNVIGATTSFSPNEPITTKEFVRWLQRAMNFDDNDLAPTNLINNAMSRITFDVSGNNAANYELSLNLLSKIVTSQTENNFLFYEPLFTTANFSTLPSNNYFTGNIVIDGEEIVTRGKMAKYIANAYKFAYKKHNGTYPANRLNANQTSTTDLNNVTIIGDKFENADIPIGNEPTPPSQVTFSCNSGSYIDMYYESDYDASGNPKHFYWSMEKNGASLTSETNSHRKVRFTAPTVSSPTQWKLYSYTANNKGKFKETIITINVGGTSGGNVTYPTQQASNLQVVANNNITNYIGLQWTRGNGAFCMVTATELPNSQSFPQDGQTYTHNQNYGMAPFIGQTKIVYIGTNNSANIIALEQNKTYRFTVCEFNDTYYNITNAPSVSATLEPLPPYSVAIQYEPSTIITGESVTFCVESEENCATVWTNSGGTATSNGTSCQDVVFNTPGTYTVSVLATTCPSNQTDEDSVTINVFSPNQLEPDFIVQNLTSNKQAASVGNSVTLNFSVINVGVVKGWLTDVSYYISTDSSVSSDDILILNDPIYNSIEILPNHSTSFSKTISIPSNVTLGNKYIIVKADGQENETETNENNNTASIGINIVDALPDLIITNASLPNGNTYQSGVAIPINLNISNIGTSNYVTQHFIDVYLSPSGNILDTNNWNESVLDISYGNYPSNTTINPVFSSLIPNGNYALILEVDQASQLNNFVQELDETNNRYTVGTITISNPNQPTVQVSNATLPNKTNNSVTLNWTNGNGTGRLILAREEQSISKNPLDNNSYTGNSVFSNAPIYENAKVVYNGIGNSTTITGLTSGKTYFFNIYEYKVTGTNVDYLQLKPETIITHLDNLNIANWTQNSSEYVGFGNLSIVNNQLKVLSIGGDGKMIQSNNNGDYFNEIKYIKEESLELGGVNQGETQFLNENLGYAIRVTKIVKTTDGGLNWTNQTIDLYGEKSLTGIYFIDSSTGFICGRGVGSDTSGVIYKTTNGGTNWNAIYFGSNRLYDIKFLNTQLGYCVGENGTVLFTNDGGASWQPKSIPLGSFTTLSIRDLAIFDSNNIIVVGYSNANGVIYRSSNSGNSWMNVLTTNDNYQIRQIDFKNSNIGYASPQYSNTVTANYIYKTIDGGTTWNQFLVPSSDIPSDIVLNNNELWLTTKQSGTGAIFSIFKYSEPSDPNVINLSNNASSICATETLSISYNITGIYNSGNVFYVQLSDSNGSFSNPLMINSFTNTGSGNLDCFLPQSLISGNYKTRILSTNPALISNVSSPLIINAASQTTISITPSATTICPNSSITLTASPTNGGTNPTYTWKRNGETVGSNSNQLTVTDATNEDIFWVEMLSNETCASSTPSVSNTVSVSVTQIDELFIQAIDNILAASTDTGVQWIRNGQPISGATSQFYEATQTGFYQFSVTVNGCVETSEIYSLTSLDTEEVTTSKNEISIFPNPVDNLLSITTTGILKSYKIIDIQGKIMMKGDSNNNAISIDTSSLPSAIYIVQVETENSNEFFKIIKK